MNWIIIVIGIIAINIIVAESRKPRETKATEYRLYPEIEFDWDAKKKEIASVSETVNEPEENERKRKQVNLMEHKLTQAQMDIDYYNSFWHDLQQQLRELERQKAELENANSVNELKRVEREIAKLKKTIYLNDKRLDKAYYYRECARDIINRGD